MLGDLGGGGKPPPKPEKAGGKGGPFGFQDTQDSSAFNFTTSTGSKFGTAFSTQPIQVGWWNSSGWMCLLFE